MQTTAKAGFVDKMYTLSLNQKGSRAEVSEDLKRRQFFERTYINMDEDLRLYCINCFFQFEDLYSVGRMSLVGLEENGI